MADRQLEARSADVVSFDSEKLILVNAADEEIGCLPKSACHDGEGVLHRAFSLFILNKAGEVLLQRRSAQKRLWPLYWANSCCSHPRHREDMQQAVARRLHEELGMRAELVFLYKFIYQAKFGEQGAEHELCWVYVGRSSDEVQPNTNEIADWRYVAPEDLDRELLQHPERFTPWLKLEWTRIRSEFREKVAAL